MDSKLMLDFFHKFLEALKKAMEEKEKNVNRQCFYLKPDCSGLRARPDFKTYKQLLNLADEVKIFYFDYMVTIYGSRFNPPNVFKGIEYKTIGNGMKPLRVDIIIDVTQEEMQQLEELFPRIKVA
jgi:hypothetical protein